MGPELPRWCEILLKLKEESKTNGGVILI